jgi:hypothetical protein
MYRDAGNWKTYGTLLLAGQALGMRDAIRDCCESGDWFVAEQVRVPSLCQQHWADCGDGPSNLDHAYHEFVDLRPASEEEAVTLSGSGSLVELLERMRAAAGRWDVRLSPNCAL